MEWRSLDLTADRQAAETDPDGFVDDVPMVIDEIQRVPELFLAIKAEVDAVLENRRGQVVGIEVKAASSVWADDFRGLRHLAAQLGDDFLLGVVLYTGANTLPFGNRMRAMPVSALWEVAPEP